MSFKSIQMIGAVVAVTGIASVSLLAAPQALATKSEKVTICHATNSQTNPYVRITVNSSAIDEQNNAAYNGHGDHDGTVWHQGIAAHSWGDIIPAFESPKGTSYPGSNWTAAGQAIYNNGCTVVAVASSHTKPTTPVAPGKSVTTPSKKPVVVPAVSTKSADTPSATPVASVASDTSNTTPSVTELPHTGASLFRVLLAGLLTSFVTYVAVYTLKRQ